MSNAFRALAKQREAVPEVNPAQCVAFGCRCRATTSVEGGKWACGAHAHVPSDRWDGVSHKVSDHKLLIEFIDEMRDMERARQDWRGFAQQFWANSDEYCMPVERENAVPYQNRMRGELLHRVGLIAKRPAPRLPQVVKTRGFRFEGLVA